ncbi:MAG TPA: YtxH domain-containing protein, partial [Candidatus Hodarchaeales archaeon]|nr:YtxH domain-containing protein [Candidatus Hodarchaeales archaeon]
MIGFLIGLIVGLLALIGYLLSTKTSIFKKTPKKIEDVDVKVYTEDFLKDIQDFDDIFGYGTATIEKETYGYTTSWDEWKEKVYTPDG